MGAQQKAYAPHLVHATPILACIYSVSFEKRIGYKLPYGAGSDRQIYPFQQGCREKCADETKLVSMPS